MRQPGEPQGHLANGNFVPGGIYSRNFTFIGSGGFYSRTVLRTIETEFIGVEAVHYADVASWRQVYEAKNPLEQRATKLVILDESQVEAFMTCDLHEVCAEAGVHIAFAVWGMAEASKLAERWADAIAISELSILPMNLNLTAWIQLIRLMDCGSHYLPASVCLKTLREGPPDERKAEPHPHSRPQTQPQPLPEESTNRAATIKLTPREREVLGHVAAGRPNKVIANELSVSSHTVKLHIHRIMTKLGVSNRTEAAIYFHTHYS